MHGYDKDCVPWNKQILVVEINPSWSPSLFMYILAVQVHFSPVNYDCRMFWSAGDVVIKNLAVYA